jgi:hypothetical protein
MALAQLDFALERAGKLPVTYVSLLRRMKMLKRAYLQGTDLLNKPKQTVEADHQDRCNTSVNCALIILSSIKSNQSSQILLNSNQIQSPGIYLNFNLKSSQSAIHESWLQTI